MIKMRYFSILAMYLIMAILVGVVSAAVYAMDNSISVSIKYNNGNPELSKEILRALTGKPLAGEKEFEVAPPDPEKELTNQIIIIRNGNVQRKNLQTPTVSDVYVSAPAEGVVNVAQTTTEPGYPVLELYWDYDKSSSEPWRYYMRVNSVNDGYAVMSDFRTKEIWRKPISEARVQDIINSGTIPEWENVK